MSRLNGVRFVPAGTQSQTQDPAFCPAPSDDSTCLKQLDSPGPLPFDGLDYWPQRLAKVIERCQPIGQQLRDHSVITSDTICGLVRSITFLAGDNQESELVSHIISKLWKDASQTFDLKGSLQWWNDLVRSAVQANMDITLNVVAVRSLVHYLSEYSIGWERHQQRADG